MRVISYAARLDAGSPFPSAIVIVAAAVIFLVDVLLLHFSPSIIVVGVLDEVAHVATALIWAQLLATHLMRPFVFGAMAGGTLIDLDHLPMFIGWTALIPVTYRPYTHSLITVAVILLVALRLSEVRREAFLGATFGLATHLVRDMATGGIPLFWPLTIQMAYLPYPLYAAAILAGLGCRRWRAVLARHL